MKSAENLIAEVRIRLAPDATSGLVAFASCRYGGVLLNDIAIRRDPTGHLFLAPRCFLWVIASLAPDLRLS